MSGKRKIYEKKVIFDWMIPPAERQRVEELLASMGYDVDGGATNFANKTAEIYIRMTRDRRTSIDTIPVTLSSEAAS